MAHSKYWGETKFTKVDVAPQNNLFYLSWYYAQVIQTIVYSINIGNCFQFIFKLWMCKLGQGFKASGSLLWGVRWRYGFNRQKHHAALPHSNRANCGLKHCKQIENLGGWVLQPEIFAVATCTIENTNICIPMSNKKSRVSLAVISHWGEVTLLVNVPTVYRNYGSLHLQVISTLNWYIHFKTIFIKLHHQI